MSEGKRYDVTILGAGLAGLTLARQLHEAAPHLDIALVSKSTFPLPDHISKVGESTVDIGAFYLKDIVGLRAELDENHLEKMGLRFIQTEKNSDYYSETGIDCFAYHKCYQINRGGLENSLHESLQGKVTFHTGCQVREVQSRAFHHVIQCRSGQEDWTVSSRWLVDASGRGRVLARQFGLERPAPLTHSAAWFRVQGLVNINELYAAGEEGAFQDHYRYRSTTHITNEGYWVWIIPLQGDVTSIGIVFDEELHDYRRIMDRERIMTWLGTHEPALHNRITECVMLDFKLLRRYSYLSSRYYSPDGWFLTGEAAGFVDPLYSNGSDFIGMGNTLITKLITEESPAFAEDVGTCNELMSLVYDTFVGTHRGSYRNFDDWYYVYTKTNWDTIFYFLLFCPLFLNRKMEDLPFIRRHMGRMGEITTRHIQLCDVLRNRNANPHGHTPPRFGNMAGTVEDSAYFFLFGRDGNDYDDIFQMNCDYIDYLIDQLMAGVDSHTLFHARHDFLEKRRACETYFMD